ncbi:hypothetical protein, partial [Klebsiella aerogenes]|uniref:hypothetical protein n=1 Tax=Klebsiella aerogenes TaxID=548 RepID=UPI001954D5A9
RPLSSIALAMGSGGDPGKLMLLGGIILAIVVTLLGGMFAGLAGALVGGLIGLKFVAAVPALE